LFRIGRNSSVAASAIVSRSTSSFLERLEAMNRSANELQIQSGIDSTPEMIERYSFVTITTENLQRARDFWASAFGRAPLS
jgi:hypothetical protein